MWVKLDVRKHTGEISILHIKVGRYCLLVSYIMLVFGGDLVVKLDIRNMWGRLIWNGNIACNIAVL